LSFRGCNYDILRTGGTVVKAVESNTRRHVHSN
jgi:hypothetical protein